ncbi:unnamed protein product [Protopolystoma xenopodis]|uniref:Uncharacterized protein n=1 Tax=Protopolystoma xenopodis TaxID=117903 RepID=A0A3S5ALW0_9PLAT|nr:unnamed protein product [Protopolystoma xenopodis]
MLRNLKIVAFLANLSLSLQNEFPPHPATCSISATAKLAASLRLSASFLLESARLFDNAQTASLPKISIARDQALTKSLLAEQTLAPLSDLSSLSLPETTAAPPISPVCLTEWSIVQEAANIGKTE